MFSSLAARGPSPDFTCSAHTVFNLSIVCQSAGIRRRMARAQSRSLLLTNWLPKSAHRNRNWAYRGLFDISYKKEDTDVIPIIHHNAYIYHSGGLFTSIGFHPQVINKIWKCTCALWNDTKVSSASGKGLALTKHQAIMWSNADLWFFRIKIKITQDILLCHTSSRNVCNGCKRYHLDNIFSKYQWLNARLQYLHC